MNCSRLLESKYAPDAGWDAQLQALRAELGPLWDTLAEEVQQFLCTGEILLRELERLNDEGADYSAVIVEYSKALELELAHVCFVPFRDEILKRGRPSDPLLFECDESAASLSPSDRKQAQQSMDLFRRFILDEQPLTLGQMWRCLIWARKETPGGPILAALRANCLSRSGMRALLEPDFIANLGKYIETFRNAAAHTKPMSSELANQCRRVLFERPTGLFIVAATCAEV